MRTARASLVTIALAGALLAPAAGAAYAAAPATCVSANKEQSIGAGVSAELSMSVDGPKVVLRTSGSSEAWKVLDRTTPRCPTRRASSPAS
ncbi:hypothetical protein ABZY44_23455 [Streptomyces sp. NPDC006544]|uniref:hypothetical protein n=1 Tax=Streptomyces sp. NPDC006544 TaxID=3154583 RepID=UPI00339DF4F2